jgi:hypothetical protein
VTNRGKQLAISKIWLYWTKSIYYGKLLEDQPTWLDVRSCVRIGESFLIRIPLKPY